MTALILAAQVAAAVPPPAVVRVGPRVDCGIWQTTPVKRAPSARTPQRLGELPKANLELAVLKLDRNGCSIPVIVREDVKGDGKAAKPRL